MLETYNFKRNKKNQSINNRRTYLLKEVHNEVKNQEKTISTKINDFSLKSFKKIFCNITIFLKNECYNFSSYKNKEATSFNIKNPKKKSSDKLKINKKIIIKKESKFLTGERKIKENLKDNKNYLFEENIKTEIIITIDQIIFNLLIKPYNIKTLIL